MSVLFSVESKFELLALHRALFCAKFDENSPAPELAGSPHTAAMAERIVVALQQLEASKGTSDTWIEWLRAEGHPQKLSFVRSRIAECEFWPKWNLPERCEYVRLLLSPLIANASTMEEMLLHGDDCHFAPDP